MKSLILYIISLNFNIKNAATADIYIASLLLVYLIFWHLDFVNAVIRKISCRGYKTHVFNQFPRSGNWFNILNREKKSITENTLTLNAYSS